jgi:hypothetical protein
MSRDLVPTAHPRLIVPYVTSWSAEQDLPSQVIYRPGGGIAYADEIATDRDVHGVLWTRAFSRPHRGRPEFGKVHSLRQRRAMRRLLCQVCGGPADRAGDGVLWLLPDHRADWTAWPDGMANVEPPICLHCAGISLRLCPRLRRGAAVVRAREYPIVGVRGTLYERGPMAPVARKEAVLDYEDPAINWIRAVGLIRQLRRCTLFPPEEVVVLH